MRAYPNKKAQWLGRSWSGIGMWESLDSFHWLTLATICTEKASPYMMSAFQPKVSGRACCLGMGSNLTSQGQVGFAGPVSRVKAGIPEAQSLILDLGPASCHGGEGSNQLWEGLNPDRLAGIQWTRRNARLAVWRPSCSCTGGHISRKIDGARNRVPPAGITLGTSC